MRTDIENWSHAGLVRRAEIYRLLYELTESLHPISATGGWIRTGYIADRVGVEESTARDYLRMLLDEGLVELQNNTEKSLTCKMVWRAKLDYDPNEVLARSL